MEGDLRRPETFPAACRGIASLHHIAADYRLWVRDPQELFSVNVEGTRNILRAVAAAGTAEVVYTSSIAVLGIREDGTPSDEATPITLDDMIGPYKRSKYLAEQEVNRLVAEEGIPAVVVNPSTPVGPRDIRPTPTGRMIEQAANRKMPAFVDTGLNIVHVDDVAEAWARATGGPEPMVIRDGLRMSRKKMFFSSEKARRSLGYAPGPARQALADAGAWFEEAGRLARK